MRERPRLFKNPAILSAAGLKWAVTLARTMSNLPRNFIQETSFLTLHYKLQAGGQTVISTFGAQPSTLQMGSAQLAPFLQAQLMGLPEGARHVVELEPALAFGEHKPDLVRRVPRTQLAEANAQEVVYQKGDMLEFVTPQGQRFAGMWCGEEDTDVWIDLNHPLAGQGIRFEVHIIAIL